ncbi:MAG: hypothetical protein GON13_00555 [Nanoarchaeota archaeon]|nr:hypothetical protein [Nanoarchaeota archaeon]
MNLILVLFSGLLVGIFFRMGFGFFMGRYKSSFVCLRCGNCCKLRVNRIPFSKGNCNYLVENNVCKIYDKRPRTCRVFPFKQFFGRDYLLFYHKCAGQKKLFKELFLMVQKRLS